MKAAAIIIVTALALAAATAGGGIYIHTLKADLEQAHIRIETLQAARKLAQDAEARAMAARQVENEKAKERERLMRNVLDDHCDWSRIELPDDVARMLQNREAGGVCASGNPAR